MIKLLIRLLQRFCSFNYKILNFFRKIIVTLDVALEAYCLATFSDEELLDVNRSFYKNYTKYIDEEGIQSGLFSWEQNIAVHCPNKDAKIVLIGAGGGRECFALHNMGFKVSGYESDDRMQKFAQEFIKKKQLPYQIKKFPESTVPNEDCDIFWYGWGVYSHIMGMDNRVKMLAEAKKRISSSGYIIISYWVDIRSDYSKKLMTKVISKINRRQVEEGECYKNDSWGKCFTRNQIKEEALLAQLKIVYQSEAPYGHAIFTHKE